MLTNTSLS